MLFNSFTFIIFFITVTILYFIFPHKLRWLLLLISSYIFYMAWRPELIILIVFSTFINYFISLLIYNSSNKNKRKKYLYISLIINFGLLFIFKYTNFIGGTLTEILNFAGINYKVKNFDIILPMGISFYTFQAASYTIDVYKKRIKPIKHYGIFSLFITFFPQLVAGPIERSENLLPQFYEKHKFNSERILQGLKLMLLGFFKKIVIADRASTAVNTIFNNPQTHSGLYFIFATLLFTFQIYCDFSGYSDIAKGSAKVLGFRLMENFNKPYLSKSIKEFWKRWHISLSSWFMDYVYIPLGGNRCGNIIKCRNVFITFLVSGLWHGANWTFVIWGGLHGIYQVIGIITYKFRSFLKGENNFILKFFSILITFILTAFAWIFFRANTINDAFYIISNLFTDISKWTSHQYIYEVITSTGLNIMEIIVVCTAILFLMASEIISGKKSVFEYFEKKLYLIRLFYYILIAVFIISAGVYYNAGEFIYFQF